MLTALGALQGLIVTRRFTRFRVSGLRMSEEWMFLTAEDNR